VDYTQIDSYDCPSCKWSLHVEQAVWKEFPHQNILDYIQAKVKKHVEDFHNQGLFISHKNIESYVSSPYIEWPKNPGI